MTLKKLQTMDVVNLVVTNVAIVILNVRNGLFQFYCAILFFNYTTTQKMDISKLFTNDTINSLMTNYTSNTSKAALDNFFNAYKKIEKKYKFINLKRDDVEELLATVNNIYSDVQNAEKIAEVGENYFKNASAQIEKKITQHKNKYSEVRKMGLIVRGIPVVIGLIIWNKTGNIIIGAVVATVLESVLSAMFGGSSANG